MRYVVYIRIIGMALILSWGGVRSAKNEDTNDWRQEATGSTSFFNLDQGNDDPTVSFIL